MRIVQNIDVFAKRCFVNSLPRVVPLTPEFKGKRVPPKEIFGSALFPRGMCNRLLKELVPPHAARGITANSLPDTILMVIKSKY